MIRLHEHLFIRRYSLLIYLGQGKDGIHQMDGQILTQRRTELLWREGDRKNRRKDILGLGGRKEETN